MTTMAGPRKTVSIYDYPEHLNPFHEDDNHNKIRFWTIGRKLSRSNSITFKDIRNSWSLRSFMKKGKKEKPDTKSTQQNGDSSPVVYRRALQYSSASSGARSTVSSPERADRYIYGGSVTPLPRSRFQERLRSPSQHEVNSLSITPRMARSDITGSRLSVESTNPFDEGPVPPVRASRRKKKRAPLPPQIGIDSPDKESKQIELRITEMEILKEPNKNENEEVGDVNLDIELKIVEDADVVYKNIQSPQLEDKDVSADETNTAADDTTIQPHNEVNVTKEQINDDQNKKTTLVKNADSEDDILNKVSFSKVDIVKYRRNSSVNEDDIRLRRGNLEDFHSLSNKRSKSLTNALDESYVCYDINLHEDRTKDINSNEEPQKLVCKLYDDPRKKSVDHSLSSTENEFMEIDKATRELEREISKLNTALIEEDIALQGGRLSVSDIRRKFDKPNVSSPNPIPKPRRSHYGDSQSPVNGNH